MNLFLTLIIAVLAALSSFLPSTGKVYDNSTRRRGINRVTKRGYYTILVIITLIALTVIQNWLNDKEQTVKSLNQKRSFDSSLVIMKSKFEDSNIKTIVSITRVQNETLGKYGYLLDSARKKLEKIVRDSSKTKVLITESPTLKLCLGKQILLRQSDSVDKIYQCNLCSYSTSSISPSLSFDVFLADSLLSNLSFYERKILNEPNVRFPVGHEQSFNIRVDASRKYRNLIIYVHGKYKNSDGSKTIYLSEVYRYDLSGNYSDILLGDVKNKIIAYNIN